MDYWKLDGWLCCKAYSAQEGFFLLLSGGSGCVTGGASLLVPCNRIPLHRMGQIFKTVKNDQIGFHKYSVVLFITCYSSHFK